MKRTLVHLIGRALLREIWHTAMTHGHLAAAELEALAAERQAENE